VWRIVALVCQTSQLSWTCRARALRAEFSGSIAAPEGAVKTSGVRQVELRIPAYCRRQQRAGTMSPGAAAGGSTGDVQVHVPDWLVTLTPSQRGAKRGSATVSMKDIRKASRNPPSSADLPKKVVTAFASDTYKAVFEPVWFVWFYTLSQADVFSRQMCCSLTGRLERIPRVYAVGPHHDLTHVGSPTRACQTSSACRWC
jgi:hypothetical protein